ncbi:hypothetical protein GA0115245_10593, partial [Streptomyces sp. di188]
CAVWLEDEATAHGGRPGTEAASPASGTPASIWWRS